MAVRKNRTETCVGVIILATLVLIAGGVLIKQARFDPGLFTVAVPEEEGSLSAKPEATGAPAPRYAVLPEGVQPMTPPEEFGPETLSDKIDGKAELYLSAGFRGLHCQRFRKGSGGELWLEVFIFDMGEMRNAFSVYSVQRRADSRQVELTRFAYGTENALFFVNGPEYVEIIASTEGMASDLLAIGKSLVQQRTLAAEAPGELTLFPSDGLDTSSITLHASDVFGFSRLKDVFSAKYLVGGSEVRAFLSQRVSAQEAAELAADYHRFLMENGGKDIDQGLHIPGVRVVEIFDLFEIIFCQGRFLAGVHEAESVDAAGKLALLLHGELQRLEP